MCVCVCVYSFIHLNRAVGRCEPVPTYRFARPSTHLTDLNTVVTFSCHPGYLFAGGSHRKQISCTSGGWESHVTDCVGKKAVYITHTCFICFNIITNTKYNSVVCCLALGKQLCPHFVQKKVKRR